MVLVLIGSFFYFFWYRIVRTHARFLMNKCWLIFFFFFCNVNLNHRPMMACMCKNIRIALLFYCPLSFSIPDFSYIFFFFTPQRTQKRRVRLCVQFVFTIIFPRVACLNKYYLSRFICFWFVVYAFRRPSATRIITTRALKRSWNSELERPQVYNFWSLVSFLFFFFIIKLFSTYKGQWRSRENFSRGEGGRYIFCNFHF